jgi:hypothetical protein
VDPLLPDIVAVHGLDGDAYKTWTHENGCMWLKDLLSKQFPRWRVYTFGYPADVAFTRADGNLDDFARTLLAELKAVRKSKVRIGPSHILHLTSNCM